MKTDKEKAILLLKTSRGQIDGILKMIDEGRYCTDIVNQVLAAEALLKKANTLIMKQHMEKCVRTALKTGDADEKIEEIISILKKVMS